MEEKILLLNKINDEDIKCSTKGCNNKATLNLSLNSKKGYCYCEKHLDKIKNNFDEQYNSIKEINEISNKKETLYI